MSAGAWQAAGPGVTFTVERGKPSPAELAAVVTVVTALMACRAVAQDAGRRGGEDPTSRTRSGWADRSAGEDPRSWQSARLP